MAMLRNLVDDWFLTVRSARSGCRGGRQRRGRCSPDPPLHSLSLLSSSSPPLPPRSTVWATCGPKNPRTAAPTARASLTATSSLQRCCAVLCCAVCQTAAHEASLQQPCAPCSNSSLTAPTPLPGPGRLQARGRDGLLPAQPQAGRSLHNLRAGVRQGAVKIGSASGRRWGSCSLLCPPASPRPPPPPLRCVLAAGSPTPCRPPPHGCRIINCGSSLSLHAPCCPAALARRHHACWMARPSLRLRLRLHADPCRPQLTLSCSASPNKQTTASTPRAGVTAPTSTWVCSRPRAPTSPKVHRSAAAALQHRRAAGAAWRFVPSWCGRVCALRGRSPAAIAAPGCAPRPIGCNPPQWAARDDPSGGNSACHPNPIRDAFCMSLCT